MLKISIATLVSFFSLSALAQRLTIEEYVEQFKDIAMNEMRRSGVPASITLAQGILESENGNSELVKKSNNHFGIKCKSNWTGESVTHDDDANEEKQNRKQSENPLDLGTDNETPHQQEQAEGQGEKRRHDSEQGKQLQRHHGKTRHQVKIEPDQLVQ